MKTCTSAAPKLRPIASLVLIAAAGLFPPSIQAQSDARNSNPGVIPVDARPHGRTYGEWSALWWKWALEQPAALSPLTDTTGANCRIGQSGQVWFLAGTFGTSTPVTRTCTIPPGTTLFFPVANAFYSAEGTFEQMQALAKADVDRATNLSVTVDGVAIKNLHLYRAASPEFTLNLPPANIFDAPAGAYSPSAADGYYLMLTPLRPGTHTIRIYAEFPGSAVIDVTYLITVAR